MVRIIGVDDGYLIVSQWLDDDQVRDTGIRGSIKGRVVVETDIDYMRTQGHLIYIVQAAPGVL